MMLFIILLFVRFGSMIEIIDFIMIFNIRWLEAHGIIYEILVVYGKKIGYEGHYED